jgi:hypothetical protein
MAVVLQNHSLNVFLLTAGTGYFGQRTDVDSFGIRLTDQNTFGLHAMTFIDFGFEVVAQIENVLQPEG